MDEALLRIELIDSIHVFIDQRLHGIDLLQGWSLVVITLQNLFEALFHGLWIGLFSFDETFSRFVILSIRSHS